MKIYSVAEAAEKLGLSPRGVRWNLEKLLEQGLIDRNPQMRDWLITEDVMEKLQNRNKSPGRPAKESKDN